MENEPTTPPVSSFLLTAVLLTLAGWGGIFYLIINTLPSPGLRWLLYFPLVLALTGTVLPIVAFLNRRFPSVPPATSGVVLRQAIWFAIYLSTLLWLMESDVLTAGLALLLALGLVVIEWLMRLRERSEWKP